ncbi:hypothetical protein [Rhodococcus sp. IEGM 1408]|nr:hypothetical protein [Rhodococcus sp. IEGM 1408]MDV8002800.1 hypothetical protein [Rhodococcus sp. IEGM 1408]
MWISIASAPARAIRSTASAQVEMSQPDAAPSLPSSSGVQSVNAATS